MSVYPSSFKSIKHEKNYFAFVVLLFLSACGGGGGGGNNTPSSTVASSSQAIISSSSSSAQSSLAAAKKGTFIDSHVSGLEYQTATRTGVTDANGGFDYDADGEFVSFSIGGKFIGTARANSNVHVFDLEGQGQFTDTLQGQRVAQLLQTLDQDKNSSNGIQLSDATRNILQTQQSIDFTASEADWNVRLNNLASAASKTVVPLSTAITHATSTQTASGCIVPDATYPSVDEANLGKFSTAGRTCDRKARAMAFYGYIDMEMRLAENEIRSSREIAEGEIIAQAEIERLAKNNLVNNSLNLVLDFADYLNIEKKDAPAELIAKIISNTANLTKDIFNTASGLCASNPNCPDQQAFSLEMTSKVTDVIAKTAACTTGKFDKCAEAIKSSADVNALLELYYVDLPAEDAAKFADLAAAWVGLLVSGWDAAKSGKLSDSISFGGSVVDASIKTSTGFYTRTDKQKAHRSEYDNAWEITGETIKVFSKCQWGRLRSPTKIAEKYLECSREAFTYANQRSAEIAAYLGLASTVFDLSNNADDLAVARYVLSETQHYGGTNPTFEHYGIAIPTDNSQLIKAMRTLVTVVAAKVGLSDARNRYVTVSSASDSVLDLILLYNTGIKAKAAAILAGKLTSCQNIELGELNSLQFIRDPNYSYLISAPANKTLDFSATYTPSASVVGYEFNFGDGTILASDIPAASHLYNATGFYYATVAPVIKQVNGSVVSCRSKQRAVGFRVDDLKPRISSVQPLTAPLGIATAFTVKGRNLPLTSVMSIADATCQTPTNRSALGFTVQCTLGGLVGDKVVTIKTDTLVNGGTEIQQTNVVKAASSTSFIVNANSSTGTLFTVPQAASTCSFSATTSLWGLASSGQNTTLEGNSTWVSSTYVGHPIVGGALIAISPEGEAVKIGASKTLVNLTPNTTWAFKVNDSLAGYSDNIGSATVLYDCSVVNVPAMEINFDEKSLAALGVNAVAQGNYTLITGRNGGSAIKFGGISNPGFLRIPNQDGMKFTDGATFDMWVRRDGNIGMDGFGSTVIDKFHMSLIAKSHDNNGLALLTNVSGESFWASNLLAGLSKNETTQFTNIAQGSWYRITATISKTGTISIYLNKSLIKSMTYAGFDFAKINTQDLYIGKYSDSWYPLNGAVQDLRIYQKALSASEISSLQ